MHPDGMKKFITIAFHCLLPVFAGGVLYLMFRPYSLLMFRWAEFADLDGFVLSCRMHCAGEGKHSGFYHFFSAERVVGLFNVFFRVFVP